MTTTETNEFSDVLECCDRGTEFTWTAGDQQFFESRGLMIPRGAASRVG